ncbi:MAG: hypothetical protein DMF65_08675 [Acidobacteria bacterium]|nr:MAG: hypothetical protein DMF65_08675 [Acidobacteriota bacterium]
MNTNRSAQGFKSPTAFGSLSSRALFVVALFALACGEALAQEAAAQKQQMDGVPSAPPPMRYMPEDVRRRLEAERDPKARTRLSLELAEERLARVAEQANADRFEAATGELGVYEAVVDDAIHFLKTSSPGRANNKTRDLLKRVEMTLREHVPRLETIRRMLPSQHAVYLKDAIEFVREERDAALNSFYDDTVIPESRRQKEKPPVAERAKGDAPAAPEVEKKPEQH